MALPNVLVIGAQKSGTSALYQIFKRHPECEAGSRKESHFFVSDADGVFGKWERGIDWYSSLYAREATIVVDASPSYSAWPLLPGVVARAAAVLPDATIVYLVRDPVERMISHWRHWTAKGFDHRPCAEALLDPRPDNEYVVCSSYATQLRQWLDAYPQERVVVLHQDEVRTGATSLLARFGLDPVSDATARFNVTDDRGVPRPDLDTALRERLRARVEDEMHEFHDLTGVRL